MIRHSSLIVGGKHLYSYVEYLVAHKFHPVSCCRIPFPYPILWFSDRRNDKSTFLRSLSLYSPINRLPLKRQLLRSRAPLRTGCRRLDGMDWADYWWRDNTYAVASSDWITVGCQGLLYKKDLQGMMMLGGLSDSVNFRSSSGWWLSCIFDTGGLICKYMDLM